MISSPFGKQAAKGFRARGRVEEATHDHSPSAQTSYSGSGFRKNLKNPPTAVAGICSLIVPPEHHRSNPRSCYFRPTTRLTCHRENFLCCSANRDRRARSARAWHRRVSCQDSSCALEC